ncbi:MULTISPECIES: hypothetical protein [Enterobacter cloacae complex]|uniref:hypothetical protein n=1 Tax=Enterobacter cloacae complex TaxID=354276 RepID=UPI00100A0546|nr:hypothetical protein [Enterobacter hormaechei]MCU2508740.1 hypothetical protein [Enterobacter hormaechei subsp. hoffmannii]MEC5831418.1 hypothetical protein [Enterobacter hormaechei]MEC5858853.1 hypothetical protein [Enterobacter hormaechei]MEC6098406.1 hypothetical protein [Enterobacter hormaechei]QAV63035.1 hypothetical protein EQ802_20225 [Enterobacter hormaechei]
MYMRWGLLIGLFFCGLSFVIGLFVGGVEWEWRLSGHSSEVAFWSMLGGWLSGFATLFAVIVSLWMAYQASQNNVEKIHISVDPLRKQYGMGDAVFSVIKIKNLKPIDTPLMKLMIQIDGVTADLAPAGLQNIKLPYTLHQQGESWQFETNITPSSMGWTSIFQTLSVGRQLRFRKCYFIVETAMRQHRVKIPNEILIRLIKIDESVRDWKEESKIK